MFLMNKMLYKSAYEWYMNKTLSKNLQNIDWNKTGRYGVCGSATEVEMNPSE